MGINSKTYFLYQLGEGKGLLIRATRPGYNNANQNQANQADQILEAKVGLLLERYLEDNSDSQPDLIGEFQGLPTGDVLYQEHGRLDLRNLRYANTRYGLPYIFLSVAASEEEFLAIISEEDFADNGFVKEDIHLPSRSISSTDFITEQDHDLSSIPHAYTFGLEDERLKNSGG